MTDRRSRLVADPARTLLAALDAGEDVDELDALRLLAQGIDLVIREEAPVQFAGWPTGATTDGFMPDLCRAVDSRRLEVTGRCWMDFTGTLFPVRAWIILADHDSALVSVEVQFGNVDPTTAALPALQASSTIMAVSDDGGGDVTAQLLIGHRFHPIVWSEGLVCSPWAADDDLAATPVT